MSTISHKSLLFLCAFLLCQTETVFGAATSPKESNDFTCLSCFGDQNSTCATDPENAIQSLWGGDADGDLGVYNTSTVPCKDKLQCVTLVLSGQVDEVDTTMYYRNCLFDCALLQTALNVVPLNIVDNAKLVSCNSCGKSNCNTNDFSDPGDGDSDDDDNNFAIKTQSTLLLMTVMIILSSYLSILY